MAGITVVTDTGAVCAIDGIHKVRWLVLLLLLLLFLLLLLL